MQTPQKETAFEIATRITKQMLEDNKVPLGSAGRLVLPATVSKVMNALQEAGYLKELE